MALLIITNVGTWVRIKRDPERWFKIRSTMGDEPLEAIATPATDSDVNATARTITIDE